MNVCRARVLMVPSAVLLVVATAAWARADATEAQPGRPNFVVVLADDLGYGDLGCYGHPVIKTPNLDRFAAEGMKLTACYAAHPNCSPSRAGLMTGRTPYRAGIHNWIPYGSPMHLRRNEVTVASLLRDAGYATCHVGKWHLSGGFHLDDQPKPSEHGFDYWFSTQNNALPSHRSPDNFVRNGRAVGELEGYSAQLVADEAIRWLGRTRDRGKPFFLFVCFHEPHEPIATAKRFRELYPSDDTSLSEHHGNISQMDAAFGRLMSALEELGLQQNTFVFFTSDNGPAITRQHPHGSAGPLREKKGHVYEGGIRVPGLIRWPGHTQPGQTSDEPVSGVDLLPTVCAISGIPLPSDRTLDGTSMLPIFEGKPIERSTPLYWHFNSAQSEPKVSLRAGDWKLLVTLTGRELQPGGDIDSADQQAIKAAELDRFELYNLKGDPGETQNLAEAEPDRLRSLSDRLRRKYADVRDESPVWPAWQWPRYEAQRIREGRERSTSSRE